MKTFKYYILVLVLSLACGHYKLFAQDKIYEESLACLNLTSQVDKLIKASQIQTDKDLIFRFLLCFDAKYINAAELKQYSNEILFKLLEDYPKLILEIMSLNKDKIPWKNINVEISSPINDIINLDDILKNIEAISGYDDVKRDVINALTIAKDKLKK